MGEAYLQPCFVYNQLTGVEGGGCNFVGNIYVILICLFLSEKANNLQTCKESIIFSHGYMRKGVKYIYSPVFVYNQPTCIEGTL